MSEKMKPLIGYVVIEDYEEGMGHWDGSIAYPNPQGANLYWLKPEPFIQYSAYQKAITALKAANKKLDEITETLDHKNMSVNGWHLNGATEPLSKFFEENDWYADDSVLKELGEGEG